MGEEAPAIVGVAALAIDCAEPESLARWWSRLLGGSVKVGADGDATLHTAEGLAIDCLRVPEPKPVKNRLHLDLRSRDLSAATTRPSRSARRDVANFAVARERAVRTTAERGRSTLRSRNP
jgi:hypothetical protein